MIEDPQDLARLYAELGQTLLKPPAGDAAAELEFTRLFLSPQGAPCPPWQSVYIVPEGEKPRLMGLSHHSALDWYRRFGFEPTQENEPADHLGLLLLFYAHLLAGGVNDETLLRFEEQHLAWAASFAARLGEHARHPRFAQLAADLSANL
jgi:TorA maturation chaperone TorD